MTSYSRSPSPLQEIDRIVERLLEQWPSAKNRPADALGPRRAHRFGHDHDEDGHGDAEADILAQFREQAADLHERVVHEHGVFVAEFLGATGSGKTRLIERLVERAPDDERIGVIVGDVAGEDDATRFRELGVEVANVNTGKECHLDPGLIEDALGTFELDALDTLYVENVGNMVCPADFPLGAQARVIVVSSTEGDDVVRKHPLLFQACDATVINKVDLAEAVGSNLDRMAEDVDDIAPEMPVFRTAAEHSQGVDAVTEYLDGCEHGHGHAHGPESSAGHGHDEHTHDHGEHTHTHD